MSDPYVVDYKGLDPARLDRAGFRAAQDTVTWTRAEWDHPEPQGQRSRFRKKAILEATRDLILAYQE